ncbi:MAG TPA: prolipoprotein diacylglyceryl transferase [Candidatus Dormibacteraeota bacterium]|nr:prolipoprotein diacylglyceryl transferase [Candidatus Dormibacteraeota bacterium]
MEPCQLPTCLKIGMSPVGLHVGPLNIYWYGALVAIGFVAAIRLASREAEREKLDSDQLLSATLLAALCGLLGARLYFILENNPGYYLDPTHLGQALSLWQGGLSFYGAIFGGILGAWIYAARYDLPILRYLDLGALVTPLGLAIGRIGSLINGDIASYPTHGWGVEYTNPNNPLLPAGELGRTQHPVALYDVFLEAALFAGLLYLHRRRVLRPGQLSGLFLAGWGVAQLVLFAFRSTPVGFGGLKAAQLTALPVIAGGLWLYLRASGNPAADREAASNTA